MNDIFKEVIKTLMVSLLTGILSYLWGKRKGKKQSTDAIKRKEKLYIPIDDEMIDFKENNKDILERMDFPITFSFYNKIYRYEMDKNIIEKILELKKHVEEYNRINVISIAHEIIGERFTTIFKELFGSVVEATIPIVDQYGNEYEEDIYCEEYEALKYISDKEIKSLIRNRNYPEYLISEIEDITYKDLVDIYSGCFNIVINGTPIKKRVIPNNWQGSISEYFAYNTNFLNEFNNNFEVKKKYELLKEIEQITFELKNNIQLIISKITKLYEKEIL